MNHRFHIASYAGTFLMAFIVWFGIGRIISQGQKLVTNVGSTTVNTPEVDSFSIPAAKQQSILILGLATESLAENDEAVLLSAWIATPNFENNVIALVSIYPTPTVSEQDDTPQFVPTDAKLVALSPTLKNFNIGSWDTTIILDRTAFGFLLDQVDNQTAAGNGNTIINKLPDPWVQPSQAYEQQKDLIRYIFMMVMSKEVPQRTTVTIADKLAALGPEHIQTDAPLPQLLIQLSIFEQNEVELIIQPSAQQALAQP